jgi:hypothetical protein
MAPKYIKDKWVPQSDAEMPSAGYDVFGTLLRQGPQPALTRIFQPDDYEQAVLKFMAGDNCDRNTAQGNMDAYLRNPADWTFSRMEEERRGYKRDYVTIQPKDVALVLVWSTFVSAVVGRGVYCIINGVDFVRILLLRFSVLLTRLLLCAINSFSASFHFLSRLLLVRLWTFYR